MFPEPDVEQEVPIFRTQGGNAAFHNFHNDYGHIQDPNQRRRLALSEIDKIPFGWYHVRAVGVAGTGFFTDSYDLFAMNLALQMVGMTFWQDNGGVIPANIQTAIKGAISGGAVVGQIGFGVLADLLGRRRMYGIELSIIIVSTLTQALSSSSSTLTMTGLLIFWRVIMGIGIGGDYPMSAIITSEFAPTRWRGAMMAAVFSMQGAGQLAAVLVALVVTVGFRESFSVSSFADCGPRCQVAADRGWRIIIGISAFPAIFALYYRLTIPETPRYTFDVSRDIEKGNADITAFKDGQAKGHFNALERERIKIDAVTTFTQPRASFVDFCTYFGNWKNGSLLFATTMSWFLVDLGFYGLGLNYKIMLASIGYGSTTDTVYHNLLNTAIGNLVIVCAGALPGYWLSVAFIDTIGRRTIQIGGFAILTVLFCIIGFAYDSLSQGALLALFIFVQLFFSFGPNTTTFIVPGENFPTRYRSTGHGISAAGGKIGATVAQIMALTLIDNNTSPDCNGKDCYPWVPHLMEIFAGVMLCGALVSLLIPETKRKTLEELAGEKPLYDTSSGTGRVGSGGKRASSSPILSFNRRPNSRPIVSGGGGGKDSGKRVHVNTSSREVGTDGSERSLCHTGSVLSAGYPSPNGSSGSANVGISGDARGPAWIESIPLHELSGPALK